MCCSDLIPARSVALWGLLTGHVSPYCFKKKPSAKALFIMRRNLIFSKEKSLLPCCSLYLFCKEGIHPAHGLSHEGIPAKWCQRNGRLKDGVRARRRALQSLHLPFSLDSADLLTRLGSGIFVFLGLCFK